MPSFSRRRLLLAAGATVLLASQAGAATDPEVMIDNFTFSPTPLRVPAGTSVKWTNRDDIPHSVLCMTLGVHSHALDTGDSFTYRFETPGTYDYMCGIHPHMRGQIIVQ